MFTGLIIMIAVLMAIAMPRTRLRSSVPTHATGPARWLGRLPEGPLMPEPATSHPAASRLRPSANGSAPTLPAVTARPAPRRIWFAQLRRIIFRRP